MQRLASIAYDGFHAYCYLGLGIVVLAINLWILFRIQFQKLHFFSFFYLAPWALVETWWLIQLGCWKTRHLHFLAFFL